MTFYEKRFLTWGLVGILGSAVLRLFGATASGAITEQLGGSGQVGAGFFVFLIEVVTVIAIPVGTALLGAFFVLFGMRRSRETADSRSAPRDVAYGDEAVTQQHDGVAREPRGE